MLLDFSCLLHHVALNKVLNMVLGWVALRTQSVSSGSCQIYDDIGYEGRIEGVQPILYLQCAAQDDTLAVLQKILA